MLPWKHEDANSQRRDQKLCSETWRKLHDAMTMCTTNPVALQQPLTSEKTQEGRTVWSSELV